MKYILLFAAINLLFIQLSYAQHDTSTYKNQYGAVVERTPLDVESWNGMISFHNKAKGYRLWLDNRVYADGAYFFDENTYNEIGNGATIRRARFAVKAKIDENWYGEIDLDFAGSAVELKDAIIGYEFDSQNAILKNLKFKAGNFKEAFSMEYTTTSRYLTFIERSLANVFVPSRVIGFQATKYGNHYYSALGLHFNSVGDAEEVTFSQDHNKTLGTDEGYSVTGKFVLMPLSAKNSVLHFGVAGSYRTPKTNWEVEDGLRYSTRSASNINRKKYLDTDDITNVDNENLLGLEFAGAHKNLFFHGEYMKSFVNGKDLNGKAGINSANFEGAFFQAGWLIFGGRYQYNRSEAEFTQVKRGKSWGDIEMVVRYDYLKLNDFDAKIYGGGANAYNFGFNFHASNNVKIMMDYTYLVHDRYASGKNKLYVGYDSNGQLTKDPLKVDSSKGTPGERFGQIQLRIEMDF